MIDINQPRNYEFLSYLKGGFARVHPVFKERIPLKDLRTHPELEERFDLLAEKMPQGVTRGYILGLAVLVNAKAVIFAIAWSMNGMAFRLDERAREDALQSLGKKRFLDEWVSFNPWPIHLQKDSVDFATWLGEMRKWLDRAIGFADVEI